MTLDAPSRPGAGGRPHPRLAGQIGSFIAIGLVSTAAYVVLYGGLRTLLSAFASNAIALFLTAIGNTAANRRLTFGVRDRSSMLRDQAAGMGAFAIALAITTGAVVLLSILAPRAGRPLEIAVLVVANVLATAVRFVLLRAVIAPDRADPPAHSADRLEGTIP
jgi:putative flippase GtrA